MNKTIRDEVYFISSSLNLGGAEVQSVWLANQFQKKGYKVSYVVLKNTTFIASYLNEDVELIQYKMYTENSKKNLLKLRQLYNFFSGVILFRKKIKHKNAVIFSFMFHANIFGFLSTIFTNRRHVICIRNDRFNSRNSTKNLKIRSILIYIATIFSTRVIFNSKKAKNVMKKRIPNKNKKELILNSITDFNLKINEETYSKIAVFLDDNKNKFVSIGRLEPLKNYENILKAFQTIKDSGIDFKYVIFGQGFLEPKLKNLILKYDLENNVLLVGGVKGAKEYLNLFDYFILCSIHEGFPNSLIEAMSKKLLPFVTDAGDSFDIVGNNRGIKIDGNEPENIASSIVCFIETKNKKKKEDIFINIENYLNTELNPDNIINKWIKLTE
tara:strand:- start:1233 stop:2384 length:1152 start_codon:yes stop_codon:yes gene_type:complete